MVWLILTELIAVFAALMAACRYYLHMLQLESYQIDGYIRFLQKNPARKWGKTLTIGAAAGVSGLILPLLCPLFTGERQKSTLISHILVLAVFIVLTVLMVYRDITLKQKKPLVFTKRMKRLVGFQALANIVIIAVFALVLKRDDTGESGYILTYISPCVLMIAAPWLPVIAEKLAEPYENSVNKKFYTMAQQKLAARKDLIKIGITGSYGKTSTKFILSEILSVKYNVFPPKSSINTPMGLSKAINTELKDEHQVFIAEMGARHVGDIKELAELVKPTMGLITSIGPQHLETFGTIENVANTKFELIKGMGKKGTGVFASDGAWVDKMYAKATGEKLLCGIGENPSFSLYAKDIETGAFGSRFTLVTAQGESVSCQTTLLGSHSISNIVLCCCAALKLGLTLDEIATGVKRLKPVEHRLQLIPGALNVIDDAFNSNPRGATEALNVLNSFPGKHLIITPGFVELGEHEKEYNYELGTKIAAACDAAILVGPKHTAPIKEGLLKAGFDRDAIRTVNTLEEAGALISRFTHPGDAVLFENDLPDNYNE